VLEAKSLACRRGKRLVFRDLGFAVDGGGLLLVRGRNGSGKSSLLRVLAGLLPAFEGEMLWSGKPVRDFAAHRVRTVYIGHYDAVKPELTVAETIGYWRALRGRKTKNDCLETFRLDELCDRSVRHLSAGQKRRLALTRLVLGDAPLWLLDEPATALDDKGQALLAGLIEKHRAKGGIAIVATHQKTDFKNARHLVLDGVSA
jgi:heme exporter protein A